ncbi:MAG: hypothetical protein HY778_03980 [Betaproteobacteria bacterium]|nr:hypothetical protein [Betaproteobacteria bacterium]
MKLARSLKAWNSPEFDDVLKREIEELALAHLPLQQGLCASSYALDDKPGVMIISVADDPGFIRAKVGIFYSGIIGGCSCADDPTPVEPQPEYCEVLIAIDKATAQASATLLADAQ